MYFHVYTSMPLPPMLHMKPSHRPRPYASGDEYTRRMTLTDKPPPHCISGLTHATHRHVTLTKGMPERST